MYEVLFSLCREYDADIAECSFRNVFPDGIREEGDCSGQIRVFTPVEAIEDLLDYHWCRPVVCNKLYRRDVALKVCFPEGKQREDECVLPFYYLAAKKIVVLDKSQYHYERRTPGSIMNTPSLKHLTVCEAFRQRLELMETFPELRKIKVKLCNSYCYVLFSMIENCIRWDMACPELLETVDKALAEEQLLIECGTDVWLLKQMDALKTLRNRYAPQSADCPAEEQTALWHKGAREWLLILFELREQKITELMGWTAELEQARDFFENQSRLKDARNEELEKQCGTLNEDLSQLQAKLDRLLGDRVIRELIKMKKYEI